MLTDLKIIQGVRSDQRHLQDKALEQLYRKNLPIVTKYIVSNSGTEEDAQEVLQDTLVVIFQAVRKADFQLTSKLDTYLYAIARNIWYKRLRKKRREISTTSIDDHTPETAWEAPEQETQAVSEDMMQLIRSMSPRCREVLTMIYVEEKGINETKEALNYQSEQAVRNKKSSCMKQLRTLFFASRSGKGKEQ